LWTAGAHRNGYGVFADTRTHPSTIVLSHRMAWGLFRGPIPDGLWVLHTCEGLYPTGDITYRRCVNPEHLKLGTVVDNHHDLSRTGRRPATHRAGQWGEAHHQARLTDALVREAKMWRAAGATYAALSLALGVDAETVRDAVLGRTWKHLQ
jgi:hypothetical protein